MLIKGADGDHDVDPHDVDSLDEISGDEQLTFAWCDTHRRYEWHWLPKRS